MGGVLPEGVRRIDCGFVNVYLVEDDDTLTLVDAGMPGCAREIRNVVRTAGYAIDDVDRVLLTHYDVDHVGGLAKLVPDLDAEVVASRTDAAMLTGERSPPWSNHKGLFQRVSRLLVSTPELPIVRIENEAPVGSFVAYHTPGHTPGHVAYVSEPLSLGLVGDLVRESGGELSPSGWFINYDTAEVRESIRLLAARAPEFQYVCPGHGDPLANGHERLERLAESF
jgi:glyoxylase-like metal-dependent hydrolase (beta-lactamase superfamily II)